MRQRLQLMFFPCCILIVLWTAIALAQDVMVEFGLKTAELETKIADALVKGYIPAYPNKTMFKSASSSAQGALVQNTLAWLRSYTQSESFKAEYGKQREAARPAAPKAARADEKYAAQLAAILPARGEPRLLLDQLYPSILCTSFFRAVGSNRG